MLWHLCKPQRSAGCYLVYSNTLKQIDRVTAMAPTLFGQREEEQQQFPKQADGELLPASLLGAARPFLRGELGKVDPELPTLVSVVQAAGAGECYHKHSTFLGHLFGVYRILKLWGAPDPVARCGLFHSAYSNSYVDLAIFEPDTGRDRVRAIVGEPAERIIHLFCIVPRHKMVHDDLQFHYTDEEIRDHLDASQASLLEATAGKASLGVLEAWRRKLRAVVPAEGVTVKHIRTGEPVALSRRMVAVFILMTIADFSDQYTDYQDKLFANEDGRFEFRGNNIGTMWPGSGKPGLWMNAMSRLAALYNLVVRDVELDKLAAAAAGTEKGDDAWLELVIPPVFDGCTVVLDPEEQKVARDLYWEVVSGAEADATQVEAKLRESISRNPFVGEPHLLLAQALMNAGRYEEAAAETERGLRLVLEWGSSWDKRVSWEGWVSWGRMMRDKAREKDWPTTAFGAIGLGLVQDVKRATI